MFSEKRCPRHIDEAQVSILIPTFERKDILAQTVQAALATGAGEIIVSDDCSQDKSLDDIKRFKDRRLVILQHSSRQGLWKNHLAALQAAKGQWIKYLQDDDYIYPWTIKQMIRHITSETSLVSVLQVFHAVEDNRIWTPFLLEHPICWKDGSYISRIPVVGNSELGNPSATLYPSHLLPRSEDAWKNDMSCDIVMNILTASKGDVTLIPPGAVIIRLHKGQDTEKQSSDLVFKRFDNSIEYLKKTSNPQVCRAARLYASSYALSFITLYFIRLLKRRAQQKNLLNYSSLYLKNVTPGIIISSLLFAVKHLMWSYKCWNKNNVRY
jgi:glycosyltransferase involved in cell wall biosynthesis